MVELDRAEGLARSVDVRAVKIAILGARSLATYTDRVLSRGFDEIGWEIVSPAEADYLLAQFHGAPQAGEDDASIVELLVSLGKRAGGLRYGILIHRPDEIQSRVSLFGDPAVLGNAAFIALLGTRHLSDDWLVRSGVPIVAVPHGYISPRPPAMRAPVVIGSHNRWGEMRRIEDAASLIVQVLASADPGSVLGYLGGDGAEKFDPVALIRREVDGNLISDIEVVHDYGMVRGAAKKRVLVVNPGPVQPLDLRPVFNVQLYHFNGRLRTGENSGSLHQYPCIPVIFEMNGAEVFEDLKVIRVPYKDDEAGMRGDFATAAKEILKWLRTDQFIDSVRHNQLRAEALSPAAVARCYEGLFAERARVSV
jgi:hypothetical protein